MDRVKEIKKYVGFVRVVLQNEEVLNIPSLLFYERKLRVGQLADKEQYEQFIKERGYTFALQKAVKMLSLKEVSEGQIREKLKKSYYLDEQIDKVIQVLQSKKLQNDERFATLYVTSKKKKYGKTRIYQELKQKGLSMQDAKDALLHVDDEEEQETADAQAQKITKNKVLDQAMYKRALASLARRGFSYSVSKCALDKIFKGTYDADEDTYD